MNPYLIQAKLRNHIKSIGSPLLYASLLMYYAYRRSETPRWAKRTVQGGFVYLFFPFDAIPDLSPLIGYTDDMGVMMYALILIAAYINPEVRSSARQTLQTWIGHIHESDLKKIDDLL